MGNFKQKIFSIGQGKVNVDKFDGNLSNEFGNALYIFIQKLVARGGMSISLGTLNKNSVKYELQGYGVQDLINSTNQSINNGSLKIEPIKKIISFSKTKNSETTPPKDPKNSERGFKYWDEEFSSRNAIINGPKLTEEISRIKDLLK